MPWRYLQSILTLILNCVLSSSYLTILFMYVQHAQLVSLIVTHDQ